MPTARKVVVPTARKVVVPTARKVVVPTARKVVVPTARKVVVPTARKVVVPTARKVVVPTARKVVVVPTARKVVVVPTARKVAVVPTARKVVVVLPPPKPKAAIVATTPRRVAPQPRPKEAVAAAPVFRKIMISGPSRTCTANGDPHFTNFNGEYFHIQEPSIFTFAKTNDGLFEVQVKQDGATKPGEPSYVRDVMVRYAGQVFHGSFARDGFIVVGGPGAVSVTVPGSYQGSMMGICGENGPSASAANFKLPNGSLADVNYKQANWALGGYGGPYSKLSSWHLSWKPSLENCMFSAAECANNLKSKKLVSVPRFISTPWGVIDTTKL